MQEFHIFNSNSQQHVCFYSKRTWGGNQRRRKTATVIEYLAFQCTFAHGCVEWEAHINLISDFFSVFVVVVLLSKQVFQLWLSTSLLRRNDCSRNRRRSSRYKEGRRQGTHLFPGHCNASFQPVHVPPIWLQICPSLDSAFQVQRR